jgi:PEP-CTERM motif
MRNGFVCIATAIAIVFSAGTVQAVDTLVYSFESGNEGFGPNGGGTYTQDTIGATQGTGSLKASIPSGATFVGAITGNLPAAIGDPPGVDYVLFDMTIGPNDVFPGAFANMGVTIWGCTQGGACGNQTQFIDEEAIAGKAAGTHSNLRINLNSSHGGGGSFNDVFGTSGSGSPLIPTHFQFFFNKSGTAPLTVYIDNVRVGQIPEPATCALLAMGLIGLGAIGRRRSR